MENALFVLDLESGGEALLTSHQGPGSFDGAFAPDGKSIYVASNLDRDLVAFGRIDLAVAGPGPIEILRERDDAELEAFEVSPRGDVVALSWNVAGKSELEIFDLATRSARPITLGTDLVSGLTFSNNGRRLAFVGRGAASPADIFVLDLTTGSGKQVTHSPHAGVALDRLVRPELVRYPAHDGLELSGWLYRPLYRPAGSAGASAYVLSFHGGPEGQERPSLRAVYQALLEQGIGVFAPNIRGSSGFGKQNLPHRVKFGSSRLLAGSGHSPSPATAPPGSPLEVSSPAS